MTNIICNECETVAHCMKNGCVPKQQALNKMADNARKLGLDYEQPAPVAKPHEQEPVAWMHPDGRIWTFGRGLDKSTFTVPLYTSPPAQRKPLSEKQKSEMTFTAKISQEMSPVEIYLQGISDAEAAHGIKENT